MNAYERWTEIKPTEDELEELESRGSGMVARDGKDICLITQTNDDVVWCLPDASGDIVTTDLKWEIVAEISQKWGIEEMPNDIGDYGTFKLGYNKIGNRSFLSALTREKNK